MLRGCRHRNVHESLRYTNMYISDGIVTLGGRGWKICQGREDCYNFYELAANETIRLSKDIFHTMQMFAHNFRYILKYNEIESQRG